MGTGAGKTITAGTTSSYRKGHMMVHFEGLTGFSWRLEAGELSELEFLIDRSLESIQRLVQSSIEGILEVTGVHIAFDWDTFALTLESSGRSEKVRFESDRWHSQDLAPDFFVAAVDFLCWLTSDINLKRNSGHTLIASFDHQRFIKRRFGAEAAEELIKTRKRVLSGDDRVGQSVVEGLALFAGQYGVPVFFEWSSLSIKMFDPEAEVHFYLDQSVWLGDNLSIQQAHLAQTFLCWLSSAIL